MNRASKQESHFTGMPMRISGWGDQSEVGISSPVLKAATIFGISNEQCQKAYQEDEITGSHICAADKNIDTCQGDSGGKS